MTERAHFFAPFVHGSLARAPLHEPTLPEPAPDGAEVELPPPARVPSLDDVNVPEFENARAQFPTAAVHADAVRMGAWLAVLGSAIAFGGLLSVYAAVRALRPEVFAYGSYYLDPRAGAVATGVLLAASLAATLSNRYAAAGRRREFVSSTLVAAALALGFVGLGVADGASKVEQGLLPGRAFAPAMELWETARFAREQPVAADRAAAFRPRQLGSDGVELTPSSTAERDELAPLVAAGALGDRAVYPDFPSRPRSAHVFFGLFYLIAGAHLLHVLASALACGFVLVRARTRGAAGLPASDAAALHLHFATIVWLFLYPLFYLAR